MDAAGSETEDDDGADDDADDIDLDADLEGCDLGDSSDDDGVDGDGDTKPTAKAKKACLLYTSDAADE